jgi:DNA (cytosine-5)-methyltransferase 1
MADLLAFRSIIFSGGDEGMKVLNLYSGIGGNRKLWQDVEVTAVEINHDIAKIYQENFPDDAIIVGDAHEYLLNHFNGFDFIWSSPPCQSHSRIRNEAGIVNGQYAPLYPDLKLYEEIIFLHQVSKLNLFSGKYVVENVIGYYDPFIEPQKIANHYFWANYHITQYKLKSRGHFTGTKNLELLKGFAVRGKGFPRNGETILRNCTEPGLGLHVFNEHFNYISANKEAVQTRIFI